MPHVNWVLSSRTAPSSDASASRAQVPPSCRHTTARASAAQRSAASDSEVSRTAAQNAFTSSMSHSTRTSAAARAQHARASASASSPLELLKSAANTSGAHSASGARGTTCRIACHIPWTSVYLTVIDEGSSTSSSASSSASTAGAGELCPNVGSWMSSTSTREAFTVRCAMASSSSSSDTAVSRMVGEDDRMVYLAGTQSQGPAVLATSE
jgi:hypothetical protein